MRLRAPLAAIAAILATAAATLVGVGAGPAAAAPTAITSPVHGGTLLAYSTGPLVVEASTGGTYPLFVSCQKGYEYTFQQREHVTLVAGTNSIALVPLQGHDGSDISGSTCTISLGHASPAITVTIVGAPLELGELSVSSNRFYPLVKDGHLDFTKLLFETNRGGSANVTITDAKGRTVHDKSFRLDGARRWYWAWNGRTTSGKPVLPGRYRATLAVTTDGVTQTRSVSTTVATRLATRRWTIDKGSRDGRVQTRGSCRYRDGNEAEGYGAVLDCRGGELAAITYTFKIPANATNVRWKVRSAATEDDFADRGTLSKTGQRISATRYQVRVQVTGYRATVVNEVLLSYKARVKI